MRDSYFHVYGRGNQKQKIFYNKGDYARFLFLLTHLQSPVTFPHIGRFTTDFVKHRVFDMFDKKAFEKCEPTLKNRYVELMAFCLMPNHYHLLVRSTVDDGLSLYMQRTLNGITKYLNTKYDLVGHIFQGPYKARVLTSENDIDYVSAYIHRNAVELSAYRTKPEQYPFSSLQDYAFENRWGSLLDVDFILDRFNSPNEYLEFVNTSGAKLLDDEI